MIIETKGDVVELSGSLHKNQWLTIRAAVNLLLHDHPQGIIVDCSHLDNISENGAKTFLEAMRDIEAAKARIVVANLPDNVRTVCNSVPGVRSQLAIADSVAQARSSLRMAAASFVNQATAANGKKSAIILVPLLTGLDLTYGAHLGGRLAKDGRSEVRLIYFLEVARTLPLGAPMMAEEQAAQESLDRAMQYARQLNVPSSTRVERVRDATEAILSYIRTDHVEVVVVGAANEPMGGEGHDTFHELVDSLLHRSPCEVVIGRLKAGE